MTTTDFTLTEEQERAVTAAVRLSRAVGAKPAVCVLAGVAGSGKTVCLRAIAAAVGDITVVTPTGRAALRVAEATGLSAMTAHKWLYIPEINGESGEVSYTRRDKITDRTTGKPLKFELPDSRLLVVDEASMLGTRLFADLYAVCLDHRLNLLLVGDGFQLSPVQEKGEPAFSVFDPQFAAEYKAERVTLTQIHRQALESPIIRASVLIRAGQAREGLQLLKQVQRKNLLTAAADVIDDGGVTILHRNVTRQALNVALRATYGLGNAPLTKGEPLLVRQNNQAVNRYNGEIVFFDAWATREGHWPEDPASQFGAKAWSVRRYKDAEPETIHYAPAIVSGGAVLLAVEEVYQATQLSCGLLRHAARDWARAHKAGTRGVKGWLVPLPYLSLNLGYAMTVHAAQGSEWDRVLVCIEPSIRLDEHEGQRWIYTAVTRAAKETQVCFLGRDLPTTTSARPLKTKQARPPVQRVLVVGDTSGAIGKALESLSQGTIKAMQDLIMEDCLANREEADSLAEDYKGLVCVPKHDGTHPVKSHLLLAKAFLNHGRTVLAWDSAGQKFDVVSKVDDAERRLVA